jgi:hypothetical protein
MALMMLLAIAEKDIERFNISCCILHVLYPEKEQVNN